VVLRFAHYALMNALLVANIAAMLTGGVWPWVSFLGAVLLSSAVDEAAGDDLRDTSGAPVRFLDAMLYLTLPLVALNVIVLAHLFGTGDPVGFGIALGLFGVDLEAARVANGPWPLLGAILAVGLFTGAAGTNVAHELTHRTDRPGSMIAGRWLLAFSFDTSFSIEHVYGHHRNVCTRDDPATARRGEYVLAFALRSFWHGNLSAWRIERERLSRKGLPILSRWNRFLTGQAMSLALVAAVWWIGSWPAVLAFAATGLQGKLYLELVNYIEHYGLVRAPGQRVETRHSWNTYRLVSSGLLYNLPRHSNHHRFATKPFWTLEPEPDGPTYPHGYMTMLLIALVPPLFNRIVAPRLEEWDRTQATAEELTIIAENWPGPATVRLAAQ
jgi:Fatty acid desaturase